VSEANGVHFALTKSRDVVSEASNSVSERSERRGAGGNRTLVR
jgi:hypothetical protein